MLAILLAAGIGCGKGDESRAPTAPGGTVPGTGTGGTGGNDGPVVVPTTLPVMRAMHTGGNWGGGIDGYKALPDAYIANLAGDNIDWVGIYVPIFSGSLSDPTVSVRYRPQGDADYAHMYSFDDADLAAAVTKYKENGFHVFLCLTFIHPEAGDHSSTCNTSSYVVDHHLLGDSSYPLIGAAAWEGRCVDGSHWWWRPSHPDHSANVARFWDTYTDVAVKYARMAQQLGVDMYGVGAESDRLFRTRSSARFPIHFKAELTRMVSAVRAEYSGLLTYSQQSFVYLDHPEWWGLDTTASEWLAEDLGLDVIGLSGYYSLTSEIPTRVWSVPEFEAGWARVFDSYLLKLQRRNPGTPIVFTDTGSADVVAAPWSTLHGSGDPFVFTDADGNGIDDGREQQRNLIQGLLNVNDRYDHLVRGMFFAWMDIDTDPYVAEWNATHRSISLHLRPAEEAIRDTYARWKTQSAQ